MILKRIHHADDNNDRKSQRVLNELENIDDECDQLGVTFVKIDNAEEAKEYGIQKVPTMLYFEKGIPMVYEGNLEDEEKVLKWLEQQQKADQIEDVTDEMLDMVIEKMPHVAVLFCQYTLLALLSFPSDISFRNCAITLFLIVDIIINTILLPLYR